MYDQDSVLSPSQSLLCKGWNLRVLLPLETTRHKAIEKHMYYLYTCDWLIVLEGGVEKLTEKELLEVSD